MNNIFRHAIFLFLLLLPAHVYAKQVMVYAGGVAGIETMMNAVSSSMYRSKGGGAYLHGSGWHRLTVDQRKKILEAFDGSPLAVEMGFGNGRAHHIAYGEKVKKEYLDLGVNPDFIAVNAYWKGKIPTVEDWKYYTQALRIHGVSKKTLIVPTFEYANFRWHMAALADNEISDRPDFQAIVTHSKGLALDCAPQYFLDYRDKVYKDWIIDAVQWAKEKGFTSIIIASPWKAMDMYEEHTVRFLNYLVAAKALPDVIVIENFEAHPKPGYVPVVGREWIPDTTLGVAWYLLNNYFQ